ncbi:MAG: YggS family pyridoxal phosphate-dependent enzyme [Candidatus Brocadiia bacterium]
MDEAKLRDNLADVRRRMADARHRAGRRPDDVRLVAVTKTVGPDAIRALQALGLREIGENRVQDALRKQETLEGRLGLRWHMIGHLQTNKARHALRLFDAVDSVDSVRLARELDRRAARDGLGPVPVLLECNVSGEGTKHGFPPGELPAALDAILPLERLAVEGLMTMAPLVADAEATRPLFAALRELAEEARRRTGRPLPHLSMGMTQDFEVAIEEGATMVRIGSALFRGT